MKPFVVLYATREGHTRRVAEHVKKTITNGGHAAEMHDITELPEHFDVYRYQGAIIAASIHGGEHEPQMVDFVKQHRSALEQVSAAFLSVSLAEATAADVHSSPAQRQRAEQKVRAKIASFLHATEWKPRRVEPVAGALLYSRRGPVARFVMMLRARRGGASTDTSHDHEYTDWEALERFVGEFVEQTCEPMSETPHRESGEVVLR